MTRQFGSAATQAIAAQAAHDFLLAGGSAVGAVLSGYFADAGTRAGVLFGPLVLVVAGLGNGVRVFDGRLRQPGLGTRRPRGFVDGTSIPVAARVAVPQAVAAAAVAHAYDRSGSFAEVIKRGVRQAKLVGALARATVLETVQTQGARAFSSLGIARPLLHTAGVSEGGLLTSADLAAVHDLDVAAEVCPFLPSWLVPPWFGECSESVDLSDASLGSIGPANHSALLCALDSRGIFAGASYQCSIGGISIMELEIEVPVAAQPVLRGVTRLAPGVCLPAASALAVKLEGTIPVCIAGNSRSMYMNIADLQAPEISISRNPATRAAVVAQRD